MNAATAANSDDDTINQSNYSSVYESSKIKCKASVDDNDCVQVGDNNTNTAANDCDNYQSAYVAQANVNTNNDVQTALATACQSLALGLDANVCANVGEEDD